MSLDIRYLTNGKKAIYRVIDAVEETFNIYNTKEDIPQRIRHYAPDEPRFVGPDIAFIFGVQDILYPNFPKCGDPEYKGERCIAESCRYAEETGHYKKCPYFDKDYKGD